MFFTGVSNKYDGSFYELQNKDAGIITSLFILFIHTDYTWLAKCPTDTSFIVIGKKLFPISHMFDESMPSRSISNLILKNT